MMLLTFGAANNSKATNDQVVLKTTSSSLVKVNNELNK
jgi:hypothetical protein